VFIVIKLDKSQSWFFIDHHSPPSLARNAPGERSSIGKLARALFSSARKPKNFQDFSPHQIFRHIHETLNIYENKN
jgi:hypothetical protein